MRRKIPDFWDRLERKYLVGKLRLVRLRYYSKLWMRRGKILRFHRERQKYSIIRMMSHDRKYAILTVYRYLRWF